MSKEIDKFIEELDTRRAQLLQAICEDDNLWHPNIILQLVGEIRSVTKMIKMLKGAEERRYDY